MLYVAGSAKYPAYFHDTFVQLASDANEDVRTVIAAQFNEVLFNDQSRSLNTSLTTPGGKSAEWRCLFALLAADTHQLGEG